MSIEGPLHADQTPELDHTPDLDEDLDLSEAPTAPVERGISGRPRPSRASAYVAMFLVGVVGGAGLFVSGFALGRLSGATPGTSDSRQDLFRPFWDAYNDVSTNYIGQVDPHLLVEGAIKGIFDALGDPYSVYMTEEEYLASLGGLSGEFEGVGIEMTTFEADGQPCPTISTTCQLTITKVIRGSPALAAGLLRDDVVLAIDGTSTIGSTLDQVAASVRGQKGTTVVLSIERDGSRMDVAVIRDVIQREDVVSEVFADGKIGYVKVIGFSSASATDLHDMLSDLIERDHVKGLILDLRDDLGGYVDAAQRISSEFVGSGPLYWEQTAGQEPVAQNPTPGGVATDPAVPVVVLVNASTASASEIVAGAIQGNSRGQLVGVITFGKGTIQEFKQLPGAGGYRLSVRKWLTPDQTWVHGVGLTPDVIVDGPSNAQPDVDPQLNRGVELLLEKIKASPAPSLLPSPTPAALAAPAGLG
jgi:carboxyl-terminal processing protease